MIVHERLFEQLLSYEHVWNERNMIVIENSIIIPKDELATNKAQMLELNLIVFAGLDDV